MDKEDYMRIAIEEAMIGAKLDEVPVGAVVVRKGIVIARAHNRKESDNSAVLHAEILALIEAGKVKGNWYLDDCEMYVTLEPCPMCTGAMINSRIGKLYYGAKDPKSGCCGSVMAMNNDRRFNHRFEAVGGILEQECGALLTEFFRYKRRINKEIKFKAEEE